MEVKHPEIATEMNRWINAARAKNIFMRAIGGLAVQTHNKGDHPISICEYPDYDFVIQKKQRREFEAFMQVEEVAR